MLGSSRVNDNRMSTVNANSSATGERFVESNGPRVTVGHRQTVTTFALIIGAGPIGLFTSILLARFGYSSVILERKLVRTGQPKAHAINPRSLEIFRQLGITRSDLKELATSPSDSDVIRIVDSVVGVEYGNIAYERQDEAVKEFTPEPLLNIAQPKLESYFQKLAEKSGLITIYKDWQWQSCSQETLNVIRSDAINCTTQTHMQFESKYLLACDGAHSRARAAFDIKVDIPPSKFPADVRYLSIQLSCDWRKYKSGMLWLVTGAEGGGKYFIVYDRGSSWVLMYPIRLEEPSDMFTEEYCRRVVDQVVGEKADYDIASITPWFAYLRIASDYRSKRFPNAFLLGDAAHSFPNAGGLGTNTGVQDAHNLVWKIHAVESKWASEKLLNTYCQERKPVALQNCTRSDDNQLEAIQLCAMIGEMKRDDPDGHHVNPENRQRIADQMENALNIRDNFNLQISFAYGMDEQIPSATKYHKPRCVPGGRLPHSWITRDNTTGSTLDLIDGFSFVIIAAADHQNLPRCTKDSHGTSITIQQVNRDFEAEEVWLELMGLGDGQGFVVVRPDQHIIGRVTSFEEAGKLPKTILDTQTIE